MMEIFYILLVILKILGLVIAAILALVLFILMLILFVPVRYKGNVVYKGQVLGYVKASYLLHMITLVFEWKDNSSNIELKIFGSPWNNVEKKKKNKKKKTKKKKNTKKAKQKPNTKQARSTIIHEEEIEKIPMPKFESNPQIVHKEFGKKLKKKEKTIKKKEKNKKTVFKQLENRYNNFISKWKSLIYKKDMILHEIKDEQNKDAANRIFKAAIKLLKYIFPQKHKFKLVLGTGDPATTGEAMGVISTVSILIGAVIVVYPDFENKIVELEGSFKGRARLFTIAFVLLKLYINKNVRRLIHKWNSK